MEMRLADEARFLSREYRCALAPSAFPDRDMWLEALVSETPSFERFDFNPPPFFEEWRWRRCNLALATAFWLPRLKRMRFRLAHVFYAWTQEGGGRVWLCHRARIPIVLSVHNSFPASQLSPWHERLMAESFQSVRGLYAVSDSAMECFLGTYGKYIRDTAVLSVIPNFVDVARFVPSDDARRKTRVELGIPDDAKVVGSVGRLDIQKQPYRMLEVFGRLWNERKDVYLIFCGRGPLESAIREEVARNPWADQVRFLGFRRDTERIFPALDVHVLLSRQEGFGISTAEAMACGIPVVATDVPGSRDVLADAESGTLIPYGDSERAADAVMAYLVSPERRAHAGREGRRRAETHYSKEIWSERLLRFYSEVMTSTPISGMGSA